MPCTVVASLLRRDRRFVGVSPLGRRRKRSRKMSDLGEEGGLWARQPLGCETSSPRNKVTSMPSSVGFVPQTFARRLPWDRHRTRLWSLGVPPLWLLQSQVRCA